MCTAQTLHQVGYLAHVHAIGQGVSTVNSHKVQVIVQVGTDGTPGMPGVQHIGSPEILQVSCNHLPLLNQDGSGAYSLDDVPLAACVLAGGGAGEVVGEPELVGV